MGEGRGGGQGDGGIPKYSRNPGPRTRKTQFYPGAVKETPELETCKLEMDGLSVKHANLSHLVVLSPSLDLT